MQLLYMAAPHELLYCLLMQPLTFCCSREITMKDLRDFLPEKDAQRAFTWLDDDADGTITLQVRP